MVYFTLSGRSYLSDFLIANRCGSNQAWMWLEKLNSGVINQSYVLTGGGGANTFSHRAMWVWILFSLHKKNPSFKNCMLCLLVLSLINI